MHRRIARADQKIICLGRSVTFAVALNCLYYRRELQPYRPALADSPKNVVSFARCLGLL